MSSCSSAGHGPGLAQSFRQRFVERVGTYLLVSYSKPSYPRMSRSSSLPFLIYYPPRRVNCRQPNDRAPVFLIKGSNMSEPHVDIRDTVRDHYAKVAQRDAGCCEDDTSCGCSVSEQIGYSKADLASLPEEAEMGLGCGNPISFAELKIGEVVLDLGSGGGVDCFLASKRPDSSVSKSGFGKRAADLCSTTSLRADSIII